jgi:hypothetical protein
VVIVDECNRKNLKIKLDEIGQIRESQEKIFGKKVEVKITNPSKSCVTVIAADCDKIGSERAYVLKAGCSVTLVGLQNTWYVF